MSPRSGRPPAMSVIALLACAIVWGGSFVAAKIALRDLQPMSLAAMRFLVAAVAFAPVVVVYHARGQRLRLSELPSFLILGFLGVTTYYWIQFNGVRYTTATNVALLVTVTPVWTSVLGRLFLGEGMGARRLTGIALAFLGAALVVTKGRFDLSTGRNDAIGALLILVNTIAWAVYTTLGRSVLQRRPALFVTAWVSLLGTAMMLPFLFFMGDLRNVPSLPAVTWGALLYLGLACTALGYTLWYYALQWVRASTAAAFLYLEPLVTIVLSRIILGESLVAATVVGGAAIIAGVYRITSAGDQADRPARVRAMADHGHRRSRA